MTRAVWKGHLSIGELSCGIALHAAATTSERISFHIVNRKTGTLPSDPLMEDIGGRGPVN